jgi:hypothetical protein
MSFGSRATQAKPEALPSCSEKIITALCGLAGVFASEDSLWGVFILCARNRARCGFAIDAERWARVNWRD